MEYYVYRITNKRLKMHYYGSREAIIAENDIGIKYFSSSTDLNFIKDQQINPNDYKYKIIKKFNNRKLADEYEEYIHKKYDVANHPSFYNLANMNGKFRQNQRGKISIFDLEDQCTKMIDVELFHSSSRYESVIKHKTSVIDLRTGDFIHISIEEFKKNRRYYSGVAKNTITCYDNKLKFNIRIPKELYYSNPKRYINDSKNKIVVKRKSDGAIMKIDKSEFDKLLYDGVAVGTITCLNIKTNKHLRVSREEFLKNKNLISMGVKYCYLVNNIPMRHTDLYDYLKSIEYKGSIKEFPNIKSPEKYIDSFKKILVKDYKKHLSI